MLRCKWCANVGGDLEAITVALDTAGRQLPLCKLHTQVAFSRGYGIRDIEPDDHTGGAIPQPVLADPKTWRSSTNAFDRKGRRYDRKR